MLTILFVELICFLTTPNVVKFTIIITSRRTGERLTDKQLLEEVGGESAGAGETDKIKYCNQI